MLEENNNFNMQLQFEQNPPPRQEIPLEYTNPYGFSPEIHREKRDIRRTALAVGIPCVCLSLITYLWSAVYLFITIKLMGMSTSQAVSLADNPAAQQVLQIALSMLMFLVPFPIAARCAGYRIDSLISAKKPIVGTALPLFLFGIGFCSFSNLAMSYCSAFFKGIGIDYNVDYGDNPSGVFGFLLSFIATAIVPALVEEFACRGIVLGMLKKYGEVFAIIVSSIVFGVMHGNLDQMPFAIMVGLILGYIYVKSGSIWVSVAVHCANNAISVIFSYLENAVSTNTQNLIYILYLAASMLAAILGVYILAKKHSAEIYSLEKGETASAHKQKYTWFFTSWVIIVFLALNLIQSLTYFFV